MTDELLQRMRVNNTPTKEIRYWSRLAHSVMELTGPEPLFGRDGNVSLWLHEDSATILLDLCDDVDAKFAEVADENKLLKDLVLGLLVCGNDSLDAREWCPLYDEEAPNRCRMDGLLKRLVPISAKFEKPRAHRPLDELEDA